MSVTCRDVNQKRFQAEEVIRPVFIPLASTQRGVTSARYPVRPALLSMPACAVRLRAMSLGLSPRPTPSVSTPCHVALNISKQRQPSYFKHTRMYQRHTLLIRVTARIAASDFRVRCIHR
ncbi:hypothetical protein KCP78_05205 [Salmonella enterica subsp. enterica]|nr:hypothetical protein KCP78_05205 [Salmonella enterica subsp. enterica]